MSKQPFEKGSDVASRDIIMVNWSEDALLDILANRIKLATEDRRVSFTSLFERHAFSDYLEADRRLVQNSNGSLHKMLELGAHILLHHAGHHPNESELLAEDFKVDDQS